MFSFFKKEMSSVGTVLFRGSLAPRVENFGRLRSHGIDMDLAGNAGPDMHWRLILRHPKWGEAELVCPRGSIVPPSELIDMASSLSKREKDAARAGGCGVSVKVGANAKYLLRDRKQLLRYMSAIMGEDGVAAIDLGSELFWSREALGDELAHDADLDVEALYCLHSVIPDDQALEENPSVEWLHTHGLANIGTFDFDILRPSSGVMANASDVTRTIAFAILTESVSMTETKFQFSHPGGIVSFVPADVFDRKASPEDVKARGGPQSGHVRDRVVLCEPEGGLLSFLSRSVRPSKFLSGPIPENPVFLLTNAMTEHMAERARDTLEVFKRLSEEFKDLEPGVLVKIGYPTDDESSREHVWFEVHGFQGDKIEATCVNQPYHVAALSMNQRGLHPVAWVTDWTIITPVGTIHPRFQGVARAIRENRDQILDLLRKSKVHGNS